MTKNSHLILMLLSLAIVEDLREEGRLGLSAA